MSRIACIGTTDEFSRFSDRYEVLADGKAVPVYLCEAASYAIMTFAGRAQVEIRARQPFADVKVRPLSRGVRLERDGSVLRFAMEAGAKLSVEFDGDIRNPLFLLANPPDENKPSPDDPDVYYFESGKAYDVGVLALRSGQTAYIDEGAVVFGAMEATEAHGIAVRGRGRLDGSRWPRPKDGERQKMIVFASCKDVLVEGITVACGPTWHVVHAGCRRVRIERANVITTTWTGDGIDIVGCEDVTVESCFVRSTDDCVAVKACDYIGAHGLRDVRNVTVARSVFWNAELGNALEIGFETSCGEMCGIVFTDCDVIRCEREGWQSGGVFTIHNGDAAVIHDVLYEDIRVEDAREKLVDIKILWAQYSRDRDRGHIRDIVFRNVRVVDGPFPVSIVRGFGLDNIVRNVTFDGLTIHGLKAANANDARMVVEVSDGVKFV